MASKDIEKSLEVDEKRALETIRRVYEDGFMEINGRRYSMTSYTHKERRKVFAFFTSVQDQLKKKDFSFLDSPKFSEVEGVLETHTLFNDSTLSNIGAHWDKYPGDYLMFITTSLAVVSYPFTGAGATG